jgi:hypothetical protein
VRSIGHKCLIVFGFGMLVIIVSRWNRLRNPRAGTPKEFAFSVQNKNQVRIFSEILEENAVGQVVN